MSTLALRQQAPTLASAEEVAAAPRRRSSSKRAPFPRLLEQHVVSSSPIATGGMASVHVAVSADPTQPVLALKRVHRHLASDDLTRSLLEEASVASCIRHENVVTTYGADMIGSEAVLVMEYLPGLPLNVLLQKTLPGSIPARIAAAIVADALRGLHAAHDAADANGESLNIVHRDVSPQNILLGLDGIARVLDFGIAKAALRTRDTRVGDLKGKLGYMAPEQLREAAVDRRTDIYSAAVVLWETLVGERLFEGTSDATTFTRALRGCSTRPGALVAGIPAALDAIVMRGLAQRPQDRFATALDMARALDSVFARNPVRPSELGSWIRGVGAETLRKQARVPAELRRRTVPPAAALPPAGPAHAPLLHDATQPAQPLHPLHPLSLLDALPPPQREWAISALLFAAGSLLGFLFMLLAISPTRGVQ